MMARIFWPSDASVAHVRRCGSNQHDRSVDRFRKQVGVFPPVLLDRGGAERRIASHVACISRHVPPMTHRDPVLYPGLNEPIT